MTPNEILSQLDIAASGYEFPALDNGYVYHADARLSVFRDGSRWLMIIEALGASNPRTCECDSFQNCVYLFGNKLEQKPGLTNDGFLFPITSLPDHPLFANQYDWFIRAGANQLSIRGQRIHFDVSPENLTKLNLQLVEPPQIDPAAVLRSLLPEHRELLLAGPEDLSKRNPHNLPLLLQLDEWLHPNITSSELPSGCETFVMLAECIASGDASRYQPTQKPNTHWRNWPEGGTL